MIEPAHLIKATRDRAALSSRLAVAACCCALGLSAPSAAFAQRADEPYLVNFQVGLAGPDWVAPPAKWNWLAVEVANPTARDVDAEVALRSLESEGFGRFNLTKPFRLPARSRRQIAFPVQVAAPAGAPSIRARLEVALVADAQRVDSSSVPVRFAAEDAHLLGFVGARRDALTALDGSLLHPRGGPQLLGRALVRPVSLIAADLPDDPLGYDQLETLVLFEPNRLSLRALQWEAIDRWVRGGGSLVAVVGADAPLVDQPELQALLPVRLFGTRRVTTLSPLAEWTGEQLRTRDPLTISEAVVWDGDTLLADGANPLVVRRRHGAGSLTYVALEPADDLIGSSIYTKFWIALLERLRDRELLDLAAIEPDAPDLVEHFAGRKVVGVWLPLLVVVGYLGAVLKIMASAARSGHFGWMWLWVCVTSALFAGGGYALYRVTGPSASDALYEIWFAYGASPSQTLRMRDYVSLLPSRRGSTQLRVGSDAARPAPSVEEGASVVNSRNLPMASEIEFNAETGRVRTVEVSGFVQLPGLEAVARARESSMELELVNRSAFELSASFVKLGRRIVPVGAVGRGGRQQLQIAAARDTTVLADYETTTLLDETARLRRSILDRLLLDPLALADDRPLTRAPRGTYQGTGSRSFWAGWCDESPLEIDWSIASAGAPDGATRRALGLLAVAPRFEVQSERFLVPKGLMVLDLPDPSAGTYYYGRSTLRGDKAVQGQVLRLVYRVPDWAAGALIEQAALLVHFEGIDYRLRVYLDDEPVDLPERPRGRFALPVGRSFADGSVTLRVEVEPRGVPAQEGLRGSRWTIGEIDVECRCRRAVVEQPRISP